MTARIANSRSERTRSLAHHRPLLVRPTPGSSSSCLFRERKQPDGGSYLIAIESGMKTIELMLRSHPRGDQQRVADYADTLGALSTCAESCTACADACLGEPEHLERFRRCITTDLDCADICSATARVLTRQTDAPNEVVHAQLHACILACQVCAEECERHADMHDHCRINAEVCHHCQERCNFLLGEISSSGTADSANPDESPSLSL